MAETFTFTKRHERALIALLEEETMSAACRVSGTQRSTMQRWLKHPVFKARLERERLELFSATKVRLLSVAQEAVGTLQEVMRDEKAPKTARVAAARSVIASCVRIRELELADKLDRMEAGDDEETVLGEVVQ